jgi:hypothetical protein
MAIFDEPSRQPLPQPSFEDVTHAARKGLLSMIPFVGGVASELLGLLSSPVAERRDDWFADLERRLRDLEGRVDGFRFADLRQNEQFVSATLQATQVALRTQHPEKLEALQNAILNVAVATAPQDDDQQIIFLHLIDRFTPTHIQVLRYFQSRDQSNLARFRERRDLTDQVVRDLHDSGLLADTRPYIARNRDSEALVNYNWEVTKSHFNRHLAASFGSPLAT